MPRKPQASKKTSHGHPKVPPGNAPVVQVQAIVACVKAEDILQPWAVEKSEHAERATAQANARIAEVPAEYRDSQLSVDKHKCLLMEAFVLYHYITSYSGIQ